MATNENIKKILTKANQLKSEGEVGLAKEFISIEEGVSKIKENVEEIKTEIKEKLNGLSEELKKKLENELVLEIDKEELKGDKGDDGIDGITPSKEELISIIKPLIPKPKKGDKGDDGKDAELPNIKDVASEVSKFIKLPIEKDLEVELPKFGYSIKEGLESLKGKDRLKASAIQGLPEFNENIQRVVSANRYFYQHLDVDVSGVTTNQSIKWDGIKWIPYTPTDVGGVWGAITGTITDQTDLITLFNTKQATLISGTNIKTINGSSLLGSGDITIIASSAGSNTQVQYNDSGAFGGDANFTWNKTTKVLTLGASSLDARLVTHAIKSDASDGLLIEASNGTDVGLLGAGNTANVTWYGNHNFEAQTANTIASFGASKTLQSASVGSTLSFSANTLGLNLGNANTWTGQQTFNTSAPIFGTITSGSVLFAGASGVLQQDNTNFFWDDTNNRLGIGKNNPSYALDVVSAGNVEMWIGSQGSSFGYTLGRNTSNGFLEIFGNQGIFSGISVDQIRSAGAITIAGNAVIQNWASTLGLGSGSGAASAVLEIRNGAQNMLIGGGTGYGYLFQRNLGTGFFEITGQQSGYTGYIIGTANGANALTINDGGSVGMGVAIGSIGAKLHIVKTTLQQRIGYDASNYFDTTVGNTGGVTFDAVGSGAGFTFSDPVTVNGNLTLGTAGNKINITTGSNASAGTATLVAGTVTVNTTAVTASSIILLTRQTTAGTLGTSVDVTARTAGTSFTITANGSVLDTSTVGWLIIN